MRQSPPNRARRAILLAFAALAFAAQAAAAAAATPWPGGVAVVSYDSQAALRAALAHTPARVVRNLPALNTAEVRPRTGARRFAARLAQAPGIRFVERLARREATSEPALAPAALPGGAYEWQFAATHENAVDPAVLRAAGSVTIAVIDTGADVTAPDLAAKKPITYSMLTHSADVTDRLGHGTLVASLAAGSVSNGEGMAGFGGDAKLLVVQAADVTGVITNVDEAAAIVYAVDHGAKILNLSFGGPQTSTLEQNAIDYAVRHGALVVAAAGNSFNEGNPVEYPAALLQPPGSNGQGGRGLVVAASTLYGQRAAFSSTGSHISLAAPGEGVFGALSSEAGGQGIHLPGSTAGLYGFGSGTSFSTPEVAGAAALVWAANPHLSAQQVAEILKQTASGRGTWNPELGYGVIDVGAAVARAQGRAPAVVAVKLSGRQRGGKVHLRWSARQAASYRLWVRKDGGRDRLLLEGRQTSVSLALAGGHSYAFTVSAKTVNGSTASSAAFTVRTKKRAAAPRRRA
jgi:subtilisin family serine protease